MSHIERGPLSTYNSLADRNLNGYFSNTRMRRHLRKAGLISKCGEIVSENTYRLNMSRKEHKKHVKDMLAQAIVHKTLDLERSRQAEIKRKLEEIAKIELVRRVRTSRQQKRDDDVLPYISPRSGSSRTTSATLTSGKRLGRRHRPLSTPTSRRRRPMSALSSNYDDEDEEVVYLDDEGRPITPAHVDESELRYSSKDPIDTRHLYALDTAALRKYAMMMARIEQGHGGMTSPYLIPQVPIPPKSPHSGRTPRSAGRYRSTGDVSKSVSPKRPTTAGSAYLHPSGSPKRHMGQPESLCEVVMRYHGSNLHLAREQLDRRQDIVVEQQHCGGNTLVVFKDRLEPGTKFSFISYRHRGYPFSLSIYVDGKMDCRVSTCCEDRHKKGGRVGGKQGHFSFLTINEAVPCYKCQVEKGVRKGNQAPKRKMKRPPQQQEEVVVVETVEAPQKELEPEEDEEDASKEEILVPVEDDDRKEEKYDDDFDSSSSSSESEKDEVLKFTPKEARGVEKTTGKVDINDGSSSSDAEGNYVLASPSKGKVEKKKKKKMKKSRSSSSSSSSSSSTEEDTYEVRKNASPAPLPKSEMDGFHQMRFMSAMADDDSIEETEEIVKEVEYKKVDVKEDKLEVKEEATFESKAKVEEELKVQSTEKEVEDVRVESSMKEVEEPKVEDDVKEVDRDEEEVPVKKQERRASTGSSSSSSSSSSNNNDYSDSDDGKGAKKQDEVGVDNQRYRPQIFNTEVVREEEKASDNIVAVQEKVDGQSNQTEVQGSRVDKEEEEEGIIYKAQNSAVTEVIAVADHSAPEAGNVEEGGGREEEELVGGINDEEEEEERIQPVPVVASLQSNSADNKDDDQGPEKAENEEDMGLNTTEHKPKSDERAIVAMPPLTHELVANQDRPKVMEPYPDVGAKAPPNPPTEQFRMKDGTSSSSSSDSDSDSSMDESSSDEEKDGKEKSREKVLKTEAVVHQSEAKSDAEASQKTESDHEGTKDGGNDPDNVMSNKAGDLSVKTFPEITVSQAREGSILPLLEASQTTLEVKGVTLNKTQVYEAAEFTESAGKIYFFNIVNCNIDDDDVQKLTEALKVSPSSPVLVNLSLNPLTENCVPHLLELLRTKPSIEAIVLQGTRLGDEGVSQLVNGLLEIHQERKMAAQAGGEKTKELNDLDLSDAKFSDEGLASLCRLIRSDMDIDTLTLSHNQAVSTEAWQALGESLANNTKLETLTLDHNFIGDDGLSSIAQGLFNNSSLTALDLNHVGITGSSGKILLELLKRNTTILEITMAENNIPSSDIDNIQKYIALNRSVI